MRYLRRCPALLAGVAAMAISQQALAVDITAGDWTFSVNGNINANLTHTNCADHVQPSGGLLCTRTDPSQGDRSASTVNTGLLPTAIVFGISTTQSGYNLKAVFGLYPAITTNAGANPNGVSVPGSEPLGLSTSQIDTRQVYMQITKPGYGSVKAGRDFGLFGFDAIINDMTLFGVGVEGFMAPAPSNTSLGSIGYGYIYTDTLSQLDYTTPTFLGGLTATIGVYSPLNQFDLSGHSAASNGTAKSVPGVHEKIRYDFDVSGFKGFISTSGIFQRNTGLVNPAGTFLPTNNKMSFGVDLTTVVGYGPISVLLSGYDARGLGTTALYFDGYDATGHARRSWGYLAQTTYQLTSTVKLGVNYGVSRLGLGSGDRILGNFGSLVRENSKVTTGVYWQALPNLKLLFEGTRSFAKAQNRTLGLETASWTFDTGLFLDF
ncbi:MAG: porin [Gammaproteobacteria bacterium]|nr:porin [Gammaproteobacteria bacterium]